MDYKIVYDSEIKGLEKKVKAELERGWEPVGGPSWSEKSYRWVQALVKHK